MRLTLKPLYVATIFALSGFASHSFAQSTDADSDDAEMLEEIIITGSRIRQDPLEQRSPIQFISEQDIDVSGTLSLGDYLQTLPISGSAINRTNNSSGNLGFPPDGSGIGAGASEVDLRYLGSKRTLVLVDGKRWIRGSSASGVSGAVDLNSIPFNAIKSIEILKDGASAIYGSDAIGGVVNLITDDNYDGFKATAYYGQFDEGDGESGEIDVKFGAEGERSRAFIDISWIDQDDVGAGDRAISTYPIPSVMNGASSGTPDGRHIFTDPVSGGVSISPNVLFPTYDSNNPGSGDFRNFAFEDRFNYQPFNFLATPNTRTSIFAKAEYDLSENTTFRLLGSYNNRESTSRAAPEPLFLGPDSGSDQWLSNLVWPADHPFNPFGFDLGPDNWVFTGRRPIEAGPRIFDQNVDTYYVSAGLDGSFMAGGSEIYWDVTGIYSETNATQEKQGAFNSRRIATALGDPDICAVSPGCVPLNIVGSGSITQEMLDYVGFVQKDTSEQELKDITLNFTGSLPGFSAGDIGWAVGYEYRDESGSFTPDAAVSAGETAGVPASPTSGGFEADEFYAEVIVPVFEGSNGMHFDISGAARYSDYDLFDGETVYDLGITFAANENLVFRASYGEGYRVPHIGELFNTGSRFDASISDPCDSSIGTPPSNCGALGIPPDYVPPNPQVSVTTGGNINLNPETSDTFTAGFSWDLPFADNMDGVESMLFEFNYYDIEIDDAIQPPDAQDVLDLCVATTDPFYCNSITRSATGTILRIDGVLANIARIETSGYDWSIDMLFAETGIGQFRVQWLNTHLSDYKEFIPSPDGTITFDRAGTELGSPERGFYDWKSNLNVGWMMNDWSAHLGLRYLDSLTEQCVGLVADFGFADQLCSGSPDTNKIDSTIWTDVQLTWAPENFASADGRWSFSLGADNILDEDVPLCYSCDLNSMDGTNYPIPGTFWYARATFEID
ncbi:MAG TPA: TonB-dependent receptor [Xanthomonadales bacterium]|nr:TonB-dependent receptor [Xanthomonadales bacterium]